MAYNNGYGNGYNQQPHYQEYDMTNPRSPPMPPSHRERAPASSYDDYGDHGGSNNYDHNGYPMGGMGNSKFSSTSYNGDAYHSEPYQAYDEYRSATPVSHHSPTEFYGNNNSTIHLGPSGADDSAYRVKGAAHTAQNTSSSWQLSQNRPNSISEQKLVGYDSEDEDDFPHKSEKPKRRACCCPCCPAWLRWLCCGCILIIVALGIAIGVLAATFKTPTVKFLGASGEPQFTSNGTKWSISTSLNIQVVNPNIEGITFSDVKAVAFYPTTRGQANRPSIGGGELTNVHISSQATTNISFPFQINYDPTMDTNQAILDDIANKCGLLGGKKQQITVDYDLQLSVKVLLFTITPTVSETASFDCPIGNGQLPSSLSGLVPSGIIPSAAATATATPTQLATTSADAAVVTQSSS